MVGRLRAACRNFVETLGRLPFFRNIANFFVTLSEGKG